MLTDEHKNLIRDHCARILDELDSANPSDDTIDDAAHSISAVIVGSWEDKDPIEAMHDSIEDEGTE